MHFSHAISIKKKTVIKTVISLGTKARERNLANVSNSKTNE